MQNVDTTYTGQPTSLQENVSSSFLNSWPNLQQPPPPAIRQESLSAPGGYRQATTELSFVPMSVSPALSSMTSIPQTDMKPDTPESTQLMDMGMMVSGESGMDEHWISFMRGSGLMGPNT